jgi:phosphoribosylglycinamide formyltransferase-1
MTVKKKIRIGALASGGGTNLQAIIDRCADGSIDAEIVQLICNNPGAGALDRAEKAGIPCRIINHRDFSDRNDFDRAVVEALQETEVDLVVLAGFMRIVTETILDVYPNRVMNIHPALLPSFPGLHVQKKAIDYGAKFSGCTVHFVDTGVDTGPIIIQAVVPIFDNDTEETLSARILEREHQIYPRAIQLFAENRLKIEARRVIVDPPLSRTEADLINPPL